MLASTVFQSSPALMDGRNRGLGSRGRSDLSVSILARPDGRAQRHAGMHDITVTERFQSSPALMDGRNSPRKGAGSPRPGTFQSSPALMDGRNCRHGGVSAPRQRRFNPRPP